MFTRLNHISATDFVFVFLRKNSNTRDFTNGLIPESAGKDSRLKLTFHRSKVNLAGTSCKKHRQTWSMISKEKFKGFILSFILLLVLALNVFSCVSCDFAVLFYLLVFPYDALLLTSQGQRFKTTRLVVWGQDKFSMQALGDCAKATASCSWFQLSPGCFWPLGVYDWDHDQN